MYVGIRHFRTAQLDGRPLVSSLIFRADRWSSAVSPQPTCYGFQGSLSKLVDYPKEPDRPGLHTPPESFCTCGYYALEIGYWLKASPISWRSIYPSTITAIVGIYGKVEIHERGWRSSHQKLLGFPLTAATEYSISKSHARSYGLPTVIYPSILDFASEFGTITT